MPGYLDRINRLKLNGQLDILPNISVSNKRGKNERNELNEKTHGIKEVDSESVLIARLRAGQTWLLDHHRRWQASDLTAASDSEFSRVWNGWWELDDQLRDEHGFQGCVYGPAGKCPDGFPCRGCSDLPAPAVILVGTADDV